MFYKVKPLVLYCIQTIFDNIGSYRKIEWIQKNGLIWLRSFIFRSTLINGLFVYNIKCIIIKNTNDNRTITLKRINIILYKV